MNQKEYDLFCSICNLSDKQLLKFLKTFLPKYYSKDIYFTKDYIYAKGDIPILLCAHCDTVFQYGEREIYYDKDKEVMWSPSGLGADDRAGIYSILRIIRDGYLPSVLFTMDEELGCIGASEFIKKFPNPIEDLNFIIELDRRGKHDIVTYDCANEEFTKYIEKFGFKRNRGSFSDVVVIGEAWGVAIANLSIGYYDEHSFTEILNTKYMYSTIKKVEKILNKRNIPKFEYISAFPNLKPYSYYLDDDDFDFSWNQARCDCCHKIKADFELIEVEGKKVCGKCAEKYVDWDIQTGIPYLIKSRKKDT